MKITIKYRRKTGACVCGLPFVFPESRIGRAFSVMKTAPSAGIIRKILIFSHGNPNNSAPIIWYTVSKRADFPGVCPQTPQRRRIPVQDRILIVDDEPEIADLVEVYLQSEGFTVFKFYTAHDALDCIRREDLDLAILDIMLPDMSGFSLCRRIRQEHTYPIIMLTAKDEETDKITGLTLGADDYITKPFRPLELIARVKAQLRRYKRYNPSGPAAEAESDVLSLSGLVLNIKTHECLLNERSLTLTPTEFAILKILLENRGSVVSAEELFHQIWQDEYYSKSNNTITVHIRHLREKLGDTAEKPAYIKTVWGVGYKIERQP